jgi:TonB family protein
MSLTTNKAEVKANNRRLYPRGTIRGTVLVFFGLGKWGRLINVCEGGMAFEFYQLPPTGQRISFGLEAMSREPAEPSGKHSADSIHADGQVVWTRDFERCAGVQFVDISEGTEQQIRQWLSIEASSGAAVEGEKVQRNAIETELPERSLTLHDVTSQGTDEAQLSNAKLAQSTSPKVPWGPRSDEEPTLEEPSGAKSQIDRAALVSMARWVAVLALLAGLTVILSQRIHLAALFASIRERSIGNRAPPRAGEYAVAKTPLAFEVEAVDANNRRRLLTFDTDAPSEAWLSSGMAAFSTPNKPVSFNAAALPGERTAAGKRRSLSNLKLGTPKVTRSAMNPSTEDSTLAIDSVVPGRDAIRGDPSGTILASVAAPLPAAPEPISVGGQVQPARLISSVSPAYPALARSIGLQGEVTIDALIDSTGRVAAMKPLSGPVLLRGAAMDALRQWKYEPARLNGQPASTHLLVTMNFHLN